MNNNLFFLILAGVLFILSVVSICLAPLINGDGGLDYFSNWSLGNCEKLDVDYEHLKSTGHNDLTTTPKYQEKIDKRRIKECKNHRAMYGLEYSSLIIDIILGFICSILGLMHYLEPGKSFEKVSGIIGFITGVITTIITIVYVGYSANIFNNDAVIVVTSGTGIQILFNNKAIVHWNGEKYISDYDNTKASEEDLDIKYIKYKDLGKKQYNYDSEFYKFSTDTSSGYSSCVNIGSIPATQHGSCEYLWDTSFYSNDSIKNKYLYDRWLNTIILGVFISLCGIMLAIFGFLLFKNSSSNSSPNLVPNTENK